MRVGAGTILKRSWAVSLALGLGAVIGMPFTICGIGFIVFAACTTAMMRHQLRAALDDKSVLRPSALAPFLFIVLLVALFVAAAAGLVVTEGLMSRLFSPRSGLGSMFGFVLGTSALLFALSPFLFFPLTLMDRGIPDSVGSSLEAATRFASGWSLRRRLGLVAVTEVLIFLVPMTAAWLIEVSFSLPGRSTGWLFLCPFALWIVALPTMSAMLVSDYVGLRQTGHEAVSAERLPATLRALSAASIPATLFAVAVMGYAVLKPLPMREDYRDMSESAAAEIRIEGTSLRVVAQGDGVMIAAEDGGGVGHIPCDHDVGSVGVSRTDGGYRVHAYDVSAEDYAEGRYARVSFVDIDSEGVRLDDGFRSRQQARGGLPVLFLWLLMLTGWLFFLGRSLRHLVTARRIQSIRSSTDLERHEAILRALDGRLRLSEGSTMSIERGRLHIQGSGFVEGPSLRVMIPPQGVELLGEGDVLAGGPVALVGRYEKLTSDAMRSNVAPWPQDAKLVPGGRDQAAHVLTRKAARQAAGWLLLVVLSAVTQTLWQVLALS